MSSARFLSVCLLAVYSLLFPSPSHPAPLDASPSWSVEGGQALAQMGGSVATAGDVNGDGYADVLVGIEDYDGGQSGEGAVFLYLGSASGLAASPSWSAESDQAGAHLGVCVATAGDVNGDGFSDVIASAPFYDTSHADAGKVYLFLGSASGPAATPDWTTQSEELGAYLGFSCGTAGDVNGDGYADVIIGDMEHTGDHAAEGRALVYYGSASGLAATPDWSAEIHQPYSDFGRSVAAAGDVNGDGYADVIIGATYYDNGQNNEGGAFLYYGSASGLAAAPGWMAEGGQAEAIFGTRVRGLGDTNGDGYADIMVGAPLYDNGGADEGRVFVYYGSATGPAAAPGWTGEGNLAAARYGWSGGAAGDVNGDGYADLLVGAPFYNVSGGMDGKAFLYLGSASGFAAQPDWSWESPQTGAELAYDAGCAGDVNGDGYGDIVVGARKLDGAEADEGAAFAFHGRAGLPATTPSWVAEHEQDNSAFGFDIGTAGDVNGDGFDDIFISAFHFDAGQGVVGRVYVHHGSASGPGSAPDWIVTGEVPDVRFGISVAPAGDVNGDGYDDLLIGAVTLNPLVDPPYGRAFLYFGSPSGLETRPGWTGTGDQEGSSFGDSVAGAGDVNGDGYADIIIGFPGYENGGEVHGRAYVYLGSPLGPRAAPDWTAAGTDTGVGFGDSVAPAGDVNGDGFGDVIVGAPGYVGKAYLYLGSSSGLSGSPSWSVTGPIGKNAENGYFGWPVGSAGDVNGDGFSDIFVSAYHFAPSGSTYAYVGRVYLYHGSPSGPGASADWTLDGEGGNGWFGYAAGNAGDVNGDGYSDFIAGSPQYYGTLIQAGRAYLCLGSSSGLSAVPDWSLTGEVDYALFGASAGTAGDVNGDGYSDVMISAGMLEGWLLPDHGRVSFYYGNGGPGLPIIPRQMQSDGSARISREGSSDSTGGFAVSALGRSPMGRGKVKLEWEVKPLGVPFDSTGTAVSSAWQDSGTTGHLFTETAGGLAPDAPYRWRARFLYPPGNCLGLAAGRWFSPFGNGWSEKDLKTYSGNPVIAAAAGPNGAIAPEGIIPVSSGADQAFTITPDLGYQVADVLVDGLSIGPVTAYTFTSVTADHSIEASFAIDTFTVTATAGAHGAIDPAGARMVDYGSDISFTVTAETGWHLLDVLVDGVSIGPVTAYTFTNVTADHSIEASFAIDTFTVTATAGAHGAIDPAGARMVDYGSNISFTIAPDPGYHVEDVLVDGLSVGAVTAYTFTNVTADHTIDASFAATRLVEPAGVCGGRPLCYPTITAAVADAGPGDSVLVARGTYYERVVIYAPGRMDLEGGWDTDFASAVRDPATTVVSGGGGDDPAEDRKPLIAGASGWARLQLTVRNLTLSGGRTPNFGGGLLAMSMGSGELNVTLDGLIIEGNRAQERGGGIHAVAESGSLLNLTVTNSLILGNEALEGGGIFIHAVTEGRVNLDLVNVTVTGNRSFWFGNGLNMLAESSGEARASVVNSILWGNIMEALNGFTLQGVDVQVKGEEATAEAAVTHSDVGRWVSCGGAYLDDGTNLSLDPLFTDPLHEDFHLHEGSACIDSGTAEGAPGADFEGDMRPLDSGVDIGADEFKPLEAAGVTLISPSGGEALASGATHNITWAAPPEAVSFDVEYSPNGGRTWRGIAVGMAGKACPWSVPVARRNKRKCLVRLTGRNAAGEVLGEDRSDAFSVEVVRVTSPTAEDVFLSGDRPRIEWRINATIRPVASIRVLLTRDGGSTWEIIRRLESAATGCVWRVPAYETRSRKCRVKVVLLDRRGRVVGVGFSPGLFTVRR